LLVESAGDKKAAEGFDEFAGEAGRRELKRIEQQADKDKVFGVPSFIVDGELFFGADRIDSVRKKLTGMGLAVSSSSASAAAPLKSAL
jgi:hypothetical protein